MLLTGGSNRPFKCLDEPQQHQQQNLSMRFHQPESHQSSLQSRQGQAMIGLRSDKKLKYPLGQCKIHTSQN